MTSRNSVWKAWNAQVSICASGLLLVLLGFSSRGEAALKEMTFDEMTLSASRIVHGKVTEMRSFYGTWSHSDDWIIVTEVTLEPRTVLKGKAEEPVVFRIAGGQIGDLHQIASESPVIEPGQEVVVFLGSHPLGFEFVFAHWYGKYDVVPVVGSSEERKVRGVAGAPMTRDRTIPQLQRKIGDVERKAKAKAAKAKEDKR